MGRQDRLDWQIRFAEIEMTSAQLVEFQAHVGDDAVAAYGDSAWRAAWSSRLCGITMGSDGYLPFHDTVEHAAVLNVSTIVEPGGSTRASDVAARASAYGIDLIETGLRHFHH